MFFLAFFFVFQYLKDEEKQLPILVICLCLFFGTMGVLITQSLQEVEHVLIELFVGVSAREWHMFLS